MSIKNKAQLYLQKLKEEYNQRYDCDIKLIGEFDKSIYVPEYIEQHFENLGPKALHSYRESLTYSLSLLFLNTKIKRAEEIIEVFCQRGQVKDPTHPDYGELFWFYEEKHVRDRNGNFFNGSSLLLIRKLFSGKLHQETLDSLDEALRLLYPVFSKERSKTSLTYVNPSLGKYTMCALLAEHFALPEFKQDIIEFEKYADFLINTGVNETLTPTYIGVDLIILFMCILCTKNLELSNKAKLLLETIFLKQNKFFQNRFPTPFRRGYNGFYTTKRTDIMPYLLNWEQEFPDKRDQYLNLALATITGITSEHFPSLFSNSELENFPRTMQTKVHNNCEAYSYLDKNFSLGSFNQYPPETSVWQTVGVSGSGWQDGIVYLTLANREETSGILRLEAIDENNTFKCHPYEGDFKFDKIDRLYPHLSFPPEPKIRCVQNASSLLCLYKIDKIDAILKSFGFNLHFSRFNGKFFDLKGQEISNQKHIGPIIIKIDNIMIYIHPLTRVDMGKSDLLHCAFIKPQIEIQRLDNILDLKMFNYEGEAKRFTQNHVSGGFFVHVCSDIKLHEFTDIVKSFKIKEKWISDGINAHVDQRDSIRKVSVETVDKKLSLCWNHYTEE